MVLREGVETVLILSAVTLNSSELMSFIGTLLGVVVAILFLSLIHIFLGDAYEIVIQRNRCPHSTDYSII